MPTPPSDAVRFTAISPAEWPASLRPYEARLLALAGARPGERALDLETGTGAVAAALVARCDVVVGVDADPGRIAAARSRWGGVARLAFEVARPEALPFPDGHFHLVTAAWAGRSVADWDAVSAEVRRVLAPGGRFVLLELGRPPARHVDLAWRAAVSLATTAVGAARHGRPRAFARIPASLRAYPGQRWVDARLRDAGFVTRLVELRGAFVALNVGIKPPAGP